MDTKIAATKNLFDEAIKRYHPQCELINNRKTLIPKDAEFIRVRCSKIGMKLNSSLGGMAGASRSTVTIDYFGFVHLKPQLEERIGNFTMYGNKKSEIFPENQESSIESVTHRRLNVVLFGLDAVSHMNFIRVMPLTHKYLTQNLSAFGFNGYVKVADNTFPNLVPFLTGKSVKELRNTCWKNAKQRFDKCPFIWKNYSNHGFRTAYSEDEVWMSTFNYHKRGFGEQPADYYFNTFLNQLGRRLGHHNLVNTNYCYGPRPGLDLSLNFLRQMAYTMNKTRPYFQFTWSNAATHDQLNYGRLGDKAVADTLARFKSGGFFEDTALILLSDHGLRWGVLRSSFQGRMEERMPFLYFILPQWFTLKYPEATRSLKINRNKMTTPFDLHETLLDLLDLGRTSSSAIVRRNLELSEKQELPRGISMFLPIPARRTCKDAEIAEHYCVCAILKSIPVENNTLIREAAENIVSSINSFLISKSRKCSTLSLDKIFNAQVWQSAQSTKTSQNTTRSNRAPKLKNEVTFTVSFSVIPSNATFEATSTRFANGSWQVSGRASRTNLYGNESRCVTDPILKLYCYCGNL
ncbi:unnamed protein product [Allacma fusca]|uniref:Uncharacterized protein n=1 Tax=Allacma fusca TaxID=39272 RepID=A0A8J2P8T4_9HEXA|nr:unnamed protein product [Allacma fusca]